MIFVALFSNFTAGDDRDSGKHIKLLQTMSSKPTLAHGGLPANLDADILRELKETADKLCSPCKGFLAADEVRCQLRVAFQLNLT